MAAVAGDEKAHASPYDVELRILSNISLPETDARELYHYVDNARFRELAQKAVTEAKSQIEREMKFTAEPPGEVTIALETLSIFFSLKAAFKHSDFVAFLATLPARRQKIEQIVDKCAEFFLSELDKFRAQTFVQIIPRVPLQNTGHKNENSAGNDTKKEEAKSPDPPKPAGPVPTPGKEEDWLFRWSNTIFYLIILLVLLAVALNAMATAKRQNQCTETACPAQPGDWVPYPERE